MTAGASARVTAAGAVTDAAWDEFLTSTPGGDHVQSAGWARTKAFQGYEVIRIVLERGGSIVAGAQILTRRLPGVGAFGYVSRGPVVVPEDDEAAGLIIEEMKAAAGLHRIRHLVVQPGRHGDWIAELLPSHGFVPSAVSVAPTATLLVDLRPETDEIFRRLGKSARKHVRRGRREGVVIREATANDLGTFHSLVAAAAERHGFRPYSRDYFEAMWEALHPAGHLRLFFAEFEGEAVSAHLVVPFGELLLSKVVAWSGRHGGAYPNEVLEWHVIEWAKAHGFAAYDLEGVDRETATQMLTDPTAPVTLARVADAFKLKFGAAPELLPTAFDYFPSRLLAATYGRSYRLAFAGGWPKASLARLRTFTGKRRGV